ncbi:hypothetical protein KC324_g3509 [Hortaea werneckii]|nr:hypothetical protein KC324_g3509 [Hortaea werneckii]
MAAITAAEFPEVIDLVSDDSDEAGPSPPRGQRRQTLDFDDAGNLTPLAEAPFYEPFESVATSSSSRRRPNKDVKGEIIVLSDGEEVFIIDDEDPTERAETVGMLSTFDTPAFAAPEQEITAEDCLQLVLEIFPDVSHEHVLQLYDSFEALSGKTKRDNIIEKLVSNSDYPKQEKQTQRKRKRAASTDDSDAQRWEKQEREVAPSYLKGTMQAILKVEYPEMTVKYINETFALEKHLYQAYVALAAAKDNPDPLKRKLNKGRPSVRHFTTADAMATNSGWPPLVEELAAARRCVQGIRAKKILEDEKKKKEAENLRLAMERGETAECSACFDDLPMNRQVHCDGLTAHFTCYDCITAYVKSELNLLEDKQLLEKFAELEQEKAIRDAGLEDLEECPFCEYKAILPPIEEDFEFRCANPECEQTLKDYEHFDQAPLGSSRRNGKKCPLYDDVERRHEREVKQAEEAAKKQLMEDNPDLNAEDLEIKNSDRLKQAETEKVQQRAAPAGAGRAIIPLGDLLYGGDRIPDMPIENHRWPGRAPWLNGRGNGIGMQPFEFLDAPRHAPPPAEQPAQIIEPAMQASIPPNYGLLGNAPAPAFNAADQGLGAFDHVHYNNGLLGNAPAPTLNAADQGLAAFDHIHHLPNFHDDAQAHQMYAPALQPRPAVSHAIQFARDQARRQQLLHHIGQRLQIPGENFPAAAAPPPLNNPAAPATPRDPAFVPEMLGRNRVQADEADDEEVLRQRAAMRAHMRRQQMRLRMQFEQIQQLGQ